MSFCQIITNRTGRTYDLVRQSKLLITWKVLYKIRNYILIFLDCFQVSKSVNEAMLSDGDLLIYLISKKCIQS
ncbi:MAG: hypothetical protein JWR05_1533 [Mucilaginibacter sp.]|nr:hypothetical protein [Mucilaginibacter sp.]